MRVAIIEPYRLSLGMGNSIAAERLKCSLSQKGVRVRKISLQEISLKQAFLFLRRFQPHLLHGFHAYKTGPLVARWARQLDIPYLVSLRGTDVYVDLMDSRKRKVISNVLSYASAVVVFHAGMKRAVVRVFPEIERKINIIPQGVWLPLTEGSGIIHGFSREKHDVIFLVLGGVRPVKDPLFALASIAGVHQVYPQVKLVYAGAILDKSYGRRFLKEISRYPWVKYIGMVPHSLVSSLLRNSRVLVNTSLAEGMSNSVLEAMATGLPVLVRNVAGNAGYIKDHVNGCLFNTEQELFQCAKHMVEDQRYREQLGKKAKNLARKNFSKEKEARAYKKVYLNALNQSCF